MGSSQSESKPEPRDELPGLLTIRANAYFPSIALRISDPLSLTL